MTPSGWPAAVLLRVKASVTAEPDQHSVQSPSTLCYTLLSQVISAIKLINGDDGSNRGLEKVRAPTTGGMAGTLYIPCFAAGSCYLSTGYHVLLI
jgi:hypothetical protein